MANGDPLPHRDRVTRGCSGRGYDQGEVTASAFDMRPLEMPLRRISVDWVECRYADEGARNLEGSVIRMKEPRVVRPPYAVLAVSEIRNVRRGKFALDAIEFGNQSNLCHSAITGFSGTAVDLELQVDLAEIANTSRIIGAPE